MKNPYLIGVDIGASSLKMAGMRLGEKPEILFYNITELPKEHTESYAVNAIIKVMEANKFHSKDTVLTFSDESIAYRRIELPRMPRGEIASALRWKAKDMLDFEVREAVLGFEVLEEIQKDDGSRATEIMFVAIPRVVVTKKINMARAAGLSLVSINMQPFGLEDVIRLEEKNGMADTVLIADIGHKKTDICIFNKGALEFVRTIRIGSLAVSEAIAERTIPSESGEMSISFEKAELMKRESGILYDDIMLADGIDSAQFDSWMRPVLEQLSAEMRRSVDYYVRELKGHGLREAYLVGMGARLKNLDRYLGEELDMSVRKMALPSSINASRINLKEYDAVSILGLVGVILGYGRNINLLPHEYIVEKREAVEKVSLRMIAVVSAVVVGILFLFTLLRLKDYNARLVNVHAEQRTIAKIKDLRQRVAERETLEKKLQGREIPVEYIMVELSNIIPDNVVLESLEVNRGDRALNMRGRVYLPQASVQDVLAAFMEALEKSKYFRDAQLSSIQCIQTTEGEVSCFEITSSLE